MYYHYINRLYECSKGKIFIVDMKDSAVRGILKSPKQGEKVPH